MPEARQFWQNDAYEAHERNFSAQAKVQRKTLWPKVKSYSGRLQATFLAHFSSSCLRIQSSILGTTASFSFSPDESK
jgi:hypothetical protein